MRKQSLICSIAAATALLAGIGLARAAPPDSKTYMAIPTPVIACDSKEQVKQVIQSIEDGKLKEKLEELSKVKNEHGGSVCVFSPLGLLVFLESEHIGRIRDHDDPRDVWISHVLNRKMEFYVLWGEPVPEESL
jgi:hypothetical protein